MTDAILAHGTKLKMGDGEDPEVFAEIGEVGDFEDGVNSDLVDVTNHQSGGWKEFISDIKEGQELTFPVNYSDTDASHNRATGLRGKQGEAVNFQIEAPQDAERAIFTAIVQNVTRSYPVQGGALQMNVTLKPTGPSTFEDIT